MTPKWESNNNPEAHLPFSNPVSPLRRASLSEMQLWYGWSTGRICRAPKGSSQAKLHKETQQGITGQPWHQLASGVGNGISAHLQGTLGFGLEWQSAGTRKTVQVQGDNYTWKGSTDIDPIVSLERFIPKSDSTQGSNWHSFLSYTHNSLRPDAMCWWSVIFTINNVPQ